MTPVDETGYRRTMAWQLMVRALVIAVTLGLFAPTSGCKRKAKEAPEKTAEPAKAASQPAPPKQPTGPIDKGDFRVTIKPPKDPDLKQLADIFTETRALHALAEGLNSALALPRNVAIILQDCGEPNAYYDGDKHEVVVCYELVARFEELFDEEVDSDEEMAEAMFGTTFFVFFHEVGHALVHVLELPVTGKEEDAVDQLATLVLLQDEEGGVMATLAAADGMLLEAADEEELDELPFWDEHSLDEQRFYAIACMIYGADPDKNAFVVDEKMLPPERAEQCPSEYAQIASAWEKLLAPHFKP